MNRTRRTHRLTSRAPGSPRLVATVALMIGAAACGSAGSDKSIETAATASVASSTPLASTTTTTTTTTTAATEPAASELTEDEATAMAETIIAAWNAVDVPTIEEMLGPTGVYIAINSYKFDASRVHNWLDPMLPAEAALGATSRTGTRSR
jgi:hypothetical protein